MRGNDELAYWLKTARNSDKPLEMEIAAYLSASYCPHCRVDLSESHIWGYKKRAPPTYKEIFEHFNSTHYGKGKNEADAIKIIYEQKKRYVKLNFPLQGELGQREIISTLLKAVSDEEIEYVMRTQVPDRTELNSVAYGILQQLMIYESAPTHPGRGNSKFNADKRALALYKLSKEFSLPTRLIGDLIGIQSESVIAARIHRGMMINYGRKEENLPQWMKNALKNTETLIDRHAPPTRNE